MATTKVFVERIEEEKDMCVSIYFQKPSGFTFAPGDCFDLFFTEKDFDEGRIFSFSSSPTEKELRVTFRKGISEYKKRLEKGEQGNEFELRLYGSPYEFFLDRPLIFYAGGIGITVFRSILKMAVDKKIKTDITLFYSNRTEEFLFKEELEEWTKKLNLDIHYIPTQKVGRLDQDKLKSYIPKIADKNYYHYIIGPPAMVDDTKEMLTNFLFEEQHIFTDSFDGYNREND